MRRTIRINDEKKLLDFVNVSNEFQSPIDLIKGSHCVDAKSVLGVVSLGMFADFDVEILTHDEDEMLKFDKEMERFRV